MKKIIFDAVYDACKEEGFREEICYKRATDMVETFHSDLYTVDKEFLSMSLGNLIKGLTTALNNIKNS